MDSGGGCGDLCRSGHGLRRQKEKIDLFCPRAGLSRSAPSSAPAREGMRFPARGRFLRPFPRPEPGRCQRGAVAPWRSAGDGLFFALSLLKKAALPAVDRGGIFLRRGLGALWAVCPGGPGQSLGPLSRHGADPPPGLLIFCICKEENIWYNRYNICPAGGPSPPAGQGERRVYEGGFAAGQERPHRHQRE